MNEAAIKLIKEAVVRALSKNPKDIDFYQQQVEDLSKKPEYRGALRDAIRQVRQKSGRRQDHP